jgi:hypothetical protein
MNSHLRKQKKDEFQFYKRLLFAEAEYSNKITKTQANKMIIDSVKSAYESLDDKAKRHVKNAVDILRDNITGSFSEASTLELLAAISFYRDAPESCGNDLPGKKSEE